jgi:hypothetical protein
MKRKITIITIRSVSQSVFTISRSASSMYFVPS